MILSTWMIGVKGPIVSDNMLMKWTVRCLKHPRSLSTLLRWESGCVQLILLKKGSEKSTRMVLVLKAAK
jgi:hypothetical protein